LKIAFVTNTCEPIIGGVAVSVKTFSESLMRLGHQVVVFAPSYPNHRNNANNIHRIASLPTNYKWYYPLPFPLVSTYQLLKALKELSVDIIHSHHPLWLGKAALSIARNDLKKPICFTYHTLYEEYAHYVPFSHVLQLKERIKNTVTDYCNNCDLVISPSTTLATSLANRTNGRKNIQVLRTGISDRYIKIKHTFNPPAFINRNNIDRHDPLFICVTRLTNEKNCEFLINSFFLIRSEIPRAKLVIIGGGHLESQLKKKVSLLGMSQSVIFTGYVTHEEVAGYYKISHVLLFVSLTETQGLPLTESLHFGLPIVALDSMASKEMVGRLGTGVITRRIESEFADAAVQMTCNAKLAKEYADHNKDASRNFLSDDLARCLVDMYQSVL